jgi:hypothetical protein
MITYGEMSRAWEEEAVELCTGPAAVWLEENHDESQS